MLTGFIIICYVVTICMFLRWVSGELRSEIGNPLDNIRRLREKSRNRGPEKDKG